MRNKLVYVEAGTGAAHNGPAWIGKAYFSKSGKSAYFNGMALSGARGWTTEKFTNKPYWISGVKKNGEDRLG